MMKYEVDTNDLSKSELYDLLVIKDNEIERLQTRIDNYNKKILILSEKTFKAIEYMEIFAGSDGFMVNGKIFQKVIDILKENDKENK